MTGRQMVTTAPPPSGVADGEDAVVKADDLIAHRKADAAAPGLGGALVELLLDEGSSASGMPGP